MSGRQVSEAILLALAVLTVWVSSVGLARSQNAYARLHFLGPVTFLSPLLIAAATLLERGFSQQGNKALLVAVLLLVYSPVVTHATARAVLRKTQAGQEEQNPWT
jgi:multisubunit Na+/H+ antiporter MnhG subunit